MKKIFILISILSCILFGELSSSALTVAEEEALNAVKNFLNRRGTETQIDKSDNSVNFRKKDILYWVTFKEENKGMLYTLHRKTIKMVSENEDMEKNSRRIENATIASNYMNNMFPFKTLVNGSKVEFVFPIFAATPDEYLNVFQSVLNSMSDLQKDFDYCYDRAKLYTDSVHNYWSQNDTSLLVIPQKNINTVKNGKNFKITTVDFKIVDENGNDISNYGESIRKSDIKFIQPEVTAYAVKKGIYHIGMVIITPSGKTLVPEANANRTSTTVVELNTKPTVVELNGFGSPDGDFWTAGEYKVIFYEDNRIIKETSFNVL